MSLPANTNAKNAFLLGAQTVQLTYWSEMAWCEETADDAAPPASLRNVGVRVDAISTLIDDWDQDAPPELTNALKDLHDRVDAYWRAYKEAWAGVDRRCLIERLPRTESEADYAREEALVRASPLQGGAWTDLAQSQDKIANALPEELRAFFELGRMLEAVNHRTFTGGERQVEPTEEAVWLAGEFNRRLADMMAALAGEFACLAGLNWDLTDCSEIDARRIVRELREAIPQRLENPPAVPGYLGLLLDRRHHRVNRGRKSVGLRGEIRWDLLEALSRGGADGCTRDALFAIWSRRRGDAGDNSKLERAKRDLLCALAPLGVTIMADRGIGYRLVKSPRRYRPKAAGSRPSQNRRPRKSAAPRAARASRGDHPTGGIARNR
jgi:hypothetical protein